MHRPRRQRSDERATPAIGSYHELYFETVADGVEYCQAIVPHVVPPLGTLSEGQSSPVAVWLHVPRRTDTSSRGCFLYVSEAVREALERVGRMPRSTGTIARVALPNASVLVFGHDRADERSQGEAPIAKQKRRLSRVARFEDVVEDGDAILR